MPHRSANNALLLKTRCLRWTESSRSLWLRHCIIGGKQQRRWAWQSINTSGEVTVLHLSLVHTLINTGQASDTTKKPQVKFHFTLTNLRLVWLALLCLTCMTEQSKGKGKHKKHKKRARTPEVLKLPVCWHTYVLAGFMFCRVVWMSLSQMKW